jgi:hypothetical protein
VRFTTYIWDLFKYSKEGEKALAQWRPEAMFSDQKWAFKADEKKPGIQI